VFSIVSITLTAVYQKIRVLVLG